MNFNDHTYTEMCRTYQLIAISTTNTVENQLSLSSENNKSIESNLKIIKIEVPILSITEQIEESVTLANYNTTLQQFHGNIDINHFYMKNNR